MKILLVQPMSYFLAWGGAHKANRILIEGLAGRGHDCRAVATASHQRGLEAHEQFRADLEARDSQVLSFSPRAVEFLHQSVRVYAAADGPTLAAGLVAQMREFAPDWTLLSEDRSYVLLQAALQVDPARTVCLAHSPATLPFGPASFMADAAQTELLRRTAGIITVSRYMRDYIRRWVGLESAAIYLPVYGNGPFPHYGRFDKGFITLINPSAIKGLAIFVALARALPDAPFAAVPTWGATDADRATLEALPNVQLLPPSDDVNDIYAQTRVLLVPSLWGEAFGQIVIEAMLRGIPVLASDSGGLPEAKLGMDYVLPVRPIAHYQENLSEQLIPEPVVPEQDVRPWLAALRELLSDRARYEQLSADSRQAALAFVAQTGIEPFETYLQNLTPAAQAELAGIAALERDSDSNNGVLGQQLSRLSPQRRTLLARRLAAREQE